MLFRTQDGGQTLDADQRRPDAGRRDEAALVRRAHHRRQHRGRVLRHDLRGGGVAARAGARLGRQRRRARARHPRRRPVVDERDRGNPGDARVGHGGGDRAVAVRPGGRLPRGGRAPDGRHAAVPVEDGRPREDVEEPRRRPRRGTSTCTPCARTRRRRACCTRARSGASCTRPTTARAGRSSGSTCPRWRSTTSW